MSVAVVIPCRDGAAYVGEALASVSAQTRPVDQVIVVDDGSKDRSAEIARAAGAEVLTTKPPGGPSASRNAGWRHSKCDLIAFLDADDRWLPDHVATIASLLEAHPEAALAFGGIELFGLTCGRYPYHLPPSPGPVDARVPAALACVVPQMAVIVRRSALEAAGGYDEEVRVAEDFDMFARLSRVGPFISAEPVTAEYRQHGSQQTRAGALAFMLASVELRNRNWRALQGELSSQELATVEDGLRTIWDQCLHTMWRNGDREGFDAVMATDSLVPASDEISRKWRKRRAYGWHASMVVLNVGRFLRLRGIWNATAGRLLRIRRWRGGS